MGVEKILTDLSRHQGLFRMDREDLGEQLLDKAEESVRSNHAGQHSPDGERWPELNSDYAAAKARLFPGAPMGVREGDMRDGIDGTRDVSETQAVYTCGQTDLQRDHVEWFERGDPYQNRPARPFVGLNRDAKADVDSLLSNHLKANLS